MRALTAFFALAYLISWTIWSPLWLPGLGLPHFPVPVQHALGAFGPFLSALIVTAVEGGAGGVRKLLTRIVTIPRRPWVAVVALSGPFVLLALAAGVGLLTQGVGFTWDGALYSADYPELSPLLLFLFYLCTFGLGEETGWRGFALPRLELRLSPVLATLVLSAGWALWHWPLFLYWPGFTGMGFGASIGWLVSLVFGAMILTLLYDASGGSILVVIVFHAAINTVFAHRLPGSFIPSTIGAMVMGLGVLAALWLWRHPTARSAAASSAT